MTHKLEQVTENTLIVGVDIAKRIHWAQFTNSRGIPLCKPLRVDNSSEGFSNLYNQIINFCNDNGFDKIMIGFEPSGHYWRTLAWYFKTMDNILLVGVNPYHVKQTKELDDNTQSKTDQKDALVIARLIRDGRFFDIYLPENEYADLRVLRRHREQIAEERKRIIIAIRTILDEYFPEYEQIGFAIDAISTRAILRTTPFPTDILQFNADELWQRWKESPYPNIRISKKIATTFIETAEQSIGVLSGISAAHFRLDAILTQLDMLDAQINECDEAMNDIISTLDIEQYLVSVPGVGKVTAASFIAETGDLNRFDDWKQLRKLAGLNLVEQSSGQHKGKTKISKRGRPELRRIIYIIGDKGMLVSPEMMELYQYLRHRPNNQLKHNQAVLAVGIKLMRIMFHVVKYKEYYNSAKSLGEERLQQIKQIA